MRGAAVVDMKLEAVVLPVADVDRVKAFYKHWLAGGGRLRRR
jgi:catechol-2,3-dioxygenase